MDVNGIKQVFKRNCSMHNTVRVKSHSCLREKENFDGAAEDISKERAGEYKYRNLWKSGVCTDCGKGKEARLGIYGRR